MLYDKLYWYGSFRATVLKTEKQPKHALLRAFHDKYMGELSLWDEFRTWKHLDRHFFSNLITLRSPSNPKWHPAVIVFHVSKDCNLIAFTRDMG